jgi:hypothetical protein
VLGTALIERGNSDDRLPAALAPQPRVVAAALYLALAYLLGIVLFLVVLDDPGITDAGERVALLAAEEGVVVATNLLMYVSFGALLIVLAVALHDRLASAAPAVMRVATAVGLIWAGSLIASGMIANPGIGPVVAVHDTDPAQAAAT